MMRITKEVIGKASKSYLEKRYPRCTDGPLTFKSMEKHEAAIKNALEVICKDYKLVKK